jgi:hypothetical protein
MIGHCRLVQDPALSIPVTHHFYRFDTSGDIRVRAVAEFFQARILHFLVIGALHFVEIYLFGQKCKSSHLMLRMENTDIGSRPIPMYQTQGTNDRRACGVPHVVAYSHRFPSLRRRSPRAGCTDELGPSLCRCCLGIVVMFHSCYGSRFFVWRDKVIWSIKHRGLGNVSILRKMQQYSRTARRYRVLRGLESIAVR